MGGRFKKKEIPWTQVIAFHKEIARRAEESFFAHSLGKMPSERWSSILNFDPVDFDGNWQFLKDALQSTSFKNTIISGTAGELFIGGPCWVRFRKDDNAWRQEWCPFLYRSIRIVSQDDVSFQIVPEQGGWDVSPIVLSTLEKKGFSSRKSFDDLIPEVLEIASKDSQTLKRSLTQCLIAQLCNEIPDFSEMFLKKVDFTSISHSPSNWIIFSPASTGPLTENLVRDYEKLSKLVGNSPLNLGGLHIFEGFSNNVTTEIEEPTPIVPLNKSQSAALSGILASKPITVISGPPGCGKSQVVLSLMLNAWQRGISVLFASNNNKAVDVVRERLQRFETHFPIAIRAGSRRKSNVIQALDDILNFITGKNGGLFDPIEPLLAERDKLVTQKNSLSNYHASKFPQRVDEAVRSALSAYAKFQQTRVELQLLKETLLNEFRSFKVKLHPESFRREVVAPLYAWLNKIAEYRDKIQEDIVLTERLHEELIVAMESRNKAVQKVGLDSTSVRNWTWLISGHGPELMRSWFDGFKNLLSQPLDQYLASYEWHVSYETWQGEENARNWAFSSRKLAVDIKDACEQLSFKFACTESLKNKYAVQVSHMQELGIPLKISIIPSILSDWAETYALESSLPFSRLDWVPWSQRSRAIRRMKNIEKKLRSDYPLNIWREIGKLNTEGRNKLSRIIEQTQLWLSVLSEWKASKSVRDELDIIFGNFRKRYSELGDQITISIEPAIQEWMNLSRDLIDRSGCAERAAFAWQKRILAEKTKTDVRMVTKAFLGIASGNPIKEAWIKGLGISFNNVLMRLDTDPSPQTVVNARAIIYTDAMVSLTEVWAQAKEDEILCRKIGDKINSIPTLRKRCEEWNAEGPKSLIARFDISQDRLPEKNDVIFQVAEKYDDWAIRLQHFSEVRQPEYHKRIKEEYAWATRLLNEAFELLSSCNQISESTKTLKEKINNNRESWPTADIQSMFESYSPDRIRANIEGLEARIEEISFKVAQHDWLTRITNNPDIQKDIDSLYTHYVRKYEKIDETAFSFFAKALVAIPIWITTAQSPQSIPMFPGLFDILVIDEATQCTVTNILPLIYRAKRVVVIGDSEQLPAIPNISASVEYALAMKFGIEENLLNIIGHAQNDLYRATVRSLPRGRHDVITLEEHYRSHPLIIGFSNLHVYKTALKLRTDPSHVTNLPFGSSIHGQHVNGYCIRGQFNTSWFNPPEIEAVCDLVKRLKQHPETKSLSLGIVTPFRSQMDEISERLHSAQLLDGVTVGTIHTYQGDERDIMIFSPVIARGIGVGAARWVENPRNMINVAVTRARRALFVVADFEVCRQQEGILGDLVKYVETVEKLRKTSTDELELFSWMIVQGWNPFVHHVERDIEIDFVLKYEGKRLAVEVDGAQHDKTTVQDSARDTFLRSMGYDVLRISGRAVRETPSLVIKQIGERIGLSI